MIQIKASLILITLILSITLVDSRTYPMFKQCNPQWGNQQYDYSSETICQAGSLLSSLAMGLAGTGNNFNPGTLNQWLKKNDGYYSGVILLRSIDSLGYRFIGKQPNSLVKSYLDKGHIVICSIQKDGHSVIISDYEGDTLFVNDPQLSKSSYKLSDCSDNQNIVYQVIKQKQNLLIRKEE